MIQGSNQRERKGEIPHNAHTEKLRDTPRYSDETPEGEEKTDELVCPGCEDNVRCKCKFWGVIMYCLYIIAVTLETGVAFGWLG